MAGVINDVDMLKKAIENGADVNELTDDGESALLTACYNGSEDVVRALLDAKADPNLTSGPVNYDHSPLMQAAYWGINKNIVEMLLDAGAEPTHKDTRDKSTLDYLKGEEGHNKDRFKEMLAFFEECGIDE
eukprot:CAMPEP_0119331182 /NCGR_PEP_ID=MMETSP1333-20130426/80022_1 /TAXON_ID=418940 /ORGANISM="Scyphosphaera apsteinii, Strain RCC1455" /LENGTH=130 /DNA_ID=CAMNT_0007340719 /DNA_START=110 /DNA_END=502 /DNA_ORIENTATION=+